MGAGSIQSHRLQLNAERLGILQLGQDKFPTGERTFGGSSEVDADRRFRMGVLSSLDRREDTTHDAHL
jgi:hypothetical protein